MKSQIFIESFESITASGSDSHELWNSLLEGKSGKAPVNISGWPAHVKAFWKDQAHSPIACRIPETNTSQSALQKMSDLLRKVATPCLNEKNASWGIIFASTKGSLEDHVWENDYHPEMDPLSLVLEKTKENFPDINWRLSQVVSNSCASSHAAVLLASRWIEESVCEKVIILACDLIGPFIHTGFQSLKALSSTGGKPFQSDRDGLVLGEAATAIVLSRKGSIEILSAEINSEAHTVTGPSPEGRGLMKCLEKMDSGIHPDIVMAHGTATVMNDQTEDAVFAKLQEKTSGEFLITGTKWSVGHTLGASGSVDLIAGMLCLKNQKVFPLPGQEPDSQLKARGYVFGKYAAGKFETALITSLGFGGTNGAILIRRAL